MPIILIQGYFIFYTHGINDACTHSTVPYQTMSYLQLQSGISRAFIQGQIWWDQTKNQFDDGSDKKMENRSVQNKYPLISIWGFPFFYKLLVFVFAFIYKHTRCAYKRQK